MVAMRLDGGSGQAEGMGGRVADLAGHLDGLQGFDEVDRRSWRPCRVTASRLRAANRWSIPADGPVAHGRMSSAVIA
jgi:hypothetical protein